jgi:hypothetical protein
MPKGEQSRAAAPNLLKRRARTRKENKCQLCETKVKIEDQYTVTNDLESNTVSKRKNAKSHEGASHYCGECADKRIAQKQAWLDSREGNGSSPAKKAAKPAKAKKAAKAGAKKAGKKAAGKKAAKKPAKVAATSGEEEEPF